MHHQRCRSICARAKEATMQRQIINPWTWQDNFGSVQANDVTGPQRTLYCAGVGSIDADGQPVHPGDMVAQIGLALDNLETLLREAGLELTDVVRLNYYTPDIDGLLAAYGHLTGRLAAAG